MKPQRWFIGAVCLFATIAALANPNGMRHQLLEGPGPIQVIMPADLRAGEPISGTLIGDTLSKIRIAGVDGEWGPGPFSLRIPKFAASLGLSVEMSHGPETISRELVASLPSPSLKDILDLTPRVPPAAIRGKPFQVCGPFDGNSSNTKAWIGGLSVTPLAESPRDAIFGIPSGIGGTTKIRLQEGDWTTESDLRVTLGDIVIANPSIRTGERTSARLMLTGLRGLDRPLTVFVNTTNPGIVQMEGGAIQSVQIAPSEVNAEGGWTKDLGILGVVPGLYSVQMRFPSLHEPTEPSEPPLTLDWIDFPKTWSQTRDVTLKVRASYPIEVAGFTINRIEGGSPTSLLAAPSAGGFWSATVPGRTLVPGFYTVEAQASGGQGDSASIIKTIKVGNPTETPSLPGYGGGLSQQLNSISLQFSPGINATYGRVEDYWNDAHDKRKEADDARKSAADAWAEAEKLRAQAKALTELDRRLEREVPASAAKMKGLAEDIRALGNSTGNATKAALEAKVSAAQAALAGCKENCEAIKKKIADLDAEIADLEKQLTDLAAAIQAHLLADGWTGRAEFDKGKGVLRWGFWGPEDKSNKIGNNTNPETLKLTEMERKGRALQKRLKQAKDDKKKAEQELAECEERCRAAEAAVKSAQEAAAKEDERLSKAAEMHAECERIAALVNRLKAYLKDHPELQKELEDALKKLEDCPKTPEEVDAWEEALKEMMDAKAALEKELEGRADAKDAEGDTSKAEADQKDAEARALADAAHEEQERLAKLERDRRAAEAKAVADAAKAKKERDKAAAAEEERMKEEFKKWLEDAVKNGWLDDSDLERILQDAAAKAVDVGGAVGAAAGEGAKVAAKGGGRGAITRATVFEGIFQLYAMIFYWVLDGELRGAIDRLRPAFDNKEFQEILADIALNGKGKTFGRVDGRGKSYFWVRKNGKTIVYRVSRSGGVEIIGVS
ncbi:MAG: hypothetical protein JNK63_11590 [Chthonomonas sp.]|nr:hypothetical protein [Chthonomonas sp.]